MNAPVLAATLTAASQNGAHVSGESKAGAILIGVGVLVLLYIVTALITHQWNPVDVFRGFDGLASTSKLQWFLWLVVILFGYASLWVLRAEQGDYSALSSIPVNLLTVLGFSTATAAAAKGITSGYVQTGKMTKPGALPGEPGKNTGGIFQDDGGSPELAKIQMIGFTIIAIGIFLATVIHQIAIGDIQGGLPNIDASLMVLMGISQGGYLGKKLVTFGTPTLYPPNPGSGPPDTPVTLRGANLGSPPDSQLMLNGVPFDGTWSAASIQFTVPQNDPATGASWTGLPKKVPIVVSVAGQASNSLNFTVTPPPAKPAPAVT
jgi:IPT/TIG domain-containing protein